MNREKAFRLNNDANARLLFNESSLNEAREAEMVLKHQSAFVYSL